jgi:exonuclease III
MLPWNVRGLNTQARREAVCAMILATQPWIVYL